MIDNEKPSLQDFATVNSNVEKCKKDYSLANFSNAFYFLALKLILGLQDDEIDEAITDSHYLKCSGKKSGHDRGIDVVYIDSSNDIATIHFFNFKYTEKFEKITDFFSSNEIDKILIFLEGLMSHDLSLESSVNPVLYSKVTEIWEIFRTGKDNPNFVMHLCSNSYKGLEPNEKARFERGINKYSNFKIEYHFMNNLISLLRKGNRQIINAKIRAIDDKFFVKSDGDIRALIINFDARELIRIVLDNSDIRENPNISDYQELKKYSLLKDVFEDNVRIYLKQRSKINKNIKGTALSDDACRFFYDNNGITITCSSYSFPQNVRAPIVELENIQIVNGSQTIHALYEAFLEDFTKLSKIEILCRIYQTQNSVLSTQIAEYTNSQNPVKSRDVRSIDLVQQKLEKELLAKDMYYERKKNQYSDKPKARRIDAEKAGQVLMAFFHGKPSDAKNRKQIIFGEMYEAIFHDNITADNILLAYVLFEKTEAERKEEKKLVLSSPNNSYSDFYLSYTTYWILYFLGEIAKFYSLELEYKNIDKIWNLFPKVRRLIEYSCEKERDYLDRKKEKFSYLTFFKHSSKPKKYYEQLITEDNLESVIGDKSQ